MKTQDSVVIIGGGHAGYHLSNALRQSGFLGHLTLFDEQGVAPYQRPPLSKSYLLNQISAERLLFRPAAFYEQHKITLIHQKVLGISAVDKVVYYGRGEEYHYDKLIIATGSAPRVLDVGDRINNGYFQYLSTISDANKLKEKLNGCEHVVIVGAGFIGLELASAAQQLGVKNITVLDQASRVLQRAASWHFSDVVMQRHQAAGINFCMGAHMADVVTSTVLKEGVRFNPQQNAYIKHVTRASVLKGVSLRDASFLPADVIITGIGSVPSTSLASFAGLLTDNGIIVDRNLRTSDPFIYAIGDCALFSTEEGEPIRLESVQNAVAQARYLADHLMGKTRSPYQAIPWFWSDQGDMKLQIAGIVPIGGETIVLIDDSEENIYVALTYANGAWVTVESINHPLSHLAGRRLLAQPVAKRPTVAEAQQRGFVLQNWAA